MSSVALPSAASGVLAIEEALAARLGRRHCCLTNRGVTALTAALGALRLPSGTRVLFPAAMCSVPVFSASFAGLLPAFADVRPDTGNFDLADVERALTDARGEIGAVVPVHMFGAPEDMAGLSALSSRHGAVLVEDAALALGADVEGKPAGAFGRLSIVSFVRKMLPLEMGGAVLTDDPVLDGRVREFVQSLPPRVPEAREETAAAMRAFHALTGYVAAGEWRRRSLLAPFTHEFRRLLLKSVTEDDWDAPLVLRELGRLEETVSARRVRAEVLESALSHPRLLPLQGRGSSRFAYALRMKGMAVEEFLHFAETRGMRFKRVAYPDVHAVFSPRREFPGARTVEKEVMGFPVDETRPVSTFWEWGEDFTRTVEEFLKGEGDRPPFDWRGKLETRMG
jgi:dTDP-4-amino-4,6-dideoxygalactose transaminase